MAGDLFGLALAPSPRGILFVDDAGSGSAANSLRLLHRDSRDRRPTVAGSRSRRSEPPLPDGAHAEVFAIRRGEVTTHCV
jgi:hypothetical protein